MILGTLRVPWKMELGGKLPNYNRNESEFKILLKNVYVKPKICRTHEFFTLREFFFQATQCSIIQCSFLPHCGQFKGPFDSGNGFYGKNHNRNDSELKGQSLRSTRPVIGACCKISNNKICYNFGYVHEIAFCTAVPNLSQIGQP